MSVTVSLSVTQSSAVLGVRRFRGEERLGEASTFELECFSLDPVAAADVLRKPASITIVGDAGSRTIEGVVTRFVTIATDHGAQRRYRLTVQSRFALFALRRPARTFQKMTVPDIVVAVAKQAGFKDAVARLSSPLGHEPRRYVVQLEETDAAFVRRLCEEEGLFFQFEPSADGGETFVVDDHSPDASEPYDHPIQMVEDASHLDVGALVAFDIRTALRRRVGKVTLRDYDVEHPKLELEAVVTDGRAPEQQIEVYEAPGRFTDDGEGKKRAQVRLESLRAMREVCAFRTTAVSLFPGSACALDYAPSYRGAHLVRGKYFVVALRHAWSADDEIFALEVESIPLKQPYRLPIVTPKPRVAGLQSATVTGEAGQEVDPDDLGRVTVKFHWDIHGPDHRDSSVPVRVTQWQTPGSMILPRIGWEVLVAFEDGDPDRPYVIGRSFNGKQPPPQALPANKTMTSIASDSSPGAGGRTTIQMDDAAGGQHILVNAPSAAAITVAAKMKTQTLMNEAIHIAANWVKKIGGAHSVSVSDAWLASYGSQQIHVSAMQTQSVGGNMIINVGTENVLVLGANEEQVGNPVRGVLNLVADAVLARMSAAGGALSYAAMGLGFARAVGEGFISGGVEGAKSNAWQSALGVATSFIPGGTAVTAHITGSAAPFPWDPGTDPAAPKAPGGGAGDAGGGGGAAAGPGPGFRNTSVSSAMLELVGAKSSVLTPGQIAWTTLGASVLLVKGNHTTDAVGTVGMSGAGGIFDQHGSLVIDTPAQIKRKVTGVFTRKVDGTMESSASGNYQIVSKAGLTLKVTGDLDIPFGSKVTFQVGGSKISMSSSGLHMEASNIEFTELCEQSGSLTHQ